MTSRARLAVAGIGIAVGAVIAPAVSPAAFAAPTDEQHQSQQVRFAQFNASLNRAAEGQLVADLQTGTNEQAQNVAETIQRANPDVVLINEFDYVEGGTAAELFRDNYLAVGQGGASPVDYPYYFVAPVNTGVPSGFDLDNSGTVGGGNDAYGFGEFPGQYGMVIYSKYPIQTDEVRTFGNFLWKDMPGNRMPLDFYSSDEQQALRLSSKSHWDVPIEIGKKTVHLLASHPTPPVFDGPEDRNGLRNADEIRFWEDYVGSAAKSTYIYDDAGENGGLKPGTPFVIAGDLNSDPNDGDSIHSAIQDLLGSPRVDSSVTPSSQGAIEASATQGGVNFQHQSPAAYDTADFSEPPGNIRADYVLPSKGLKIEDSRVFWPTSADPLARLTGSYPFPTSDHRLVWVDVKVPGNK